MKPYVYLPSVILTVMWFGVSLANMQANDPISENNSTTSVKSSGETHSPVMTEGVTDRGQLLYENHCMACHDDSVHGRNHSKARSVDEIRQWVIRWSKHLKLDWRTEDVNMVTDFLNRRIYHYPNGK